MTTGEPGEVPQPKPQDAQRVTPPNPLRTEGSRGFQANNEARSPIQHVVPEDATPVEVIEGFLRSHNQERFAILDSDITLAERHYRLNKLYKSAFSEQARKDFEASFKPTNPSTGEPKK